MKWNVGNFVYFFAGAGSNRDDRDQAAHLRITLGHVIRKYCSPHIPNAKRNLIAIDVIEQLIGIDLPVDIAIA